MCSLPLSFFTQTRYLMPLFQCALVRQHFRCALAITTLFLFGGLAREKRCPAFVDNCIDTRKTRCELNAAMRSQKASKAGEAQRTRVLLIVHILRITNYDVFICPHLCRMRAHGLTAIAVFSSASFLFSAAGSLWLQRKQTVMIMWCARCVERERCAVCSRHTPRLACPRRAEER